MAILIDIGESLKKYLQKEIIELSDENSIVFDSPADVESPVNPKLSIFLYDIVENSFQRNPEPEFIGKDKMRYPPLILDLYYIFTPYAKNRETELLILEKIFQIFYDNPVLKGDMLKDSLKGTGNDEIRVETNNLKFDDMNKLWERFPNKPFKLPASYILTPVIFPSGRPIADIRRVLEKDIKMYQKDAREV